MQPVVALTRRCCMHSKSSFEVRFGDHPIHFIVALNRWLHDTLGRLLGRLVARLLSACLGRLHPSGL